MLRTLLSDPRLAHVDVDSPQLISIHKKILNEKRTLREVFAEFYSSCRSLDKKYFENSGLSIELGAGSSFFKKQFPEILSTDIKPSPNLDMVIDALRMPFQSGEVRALYGINCFHHFPDAEAFLKEADRVLVTGGGIILIEPYFGPLASLFYKYVFTSEHFSKSQVDWRQQAGHTGPMNGANQALSYIVFFRDKKILKEKFPNFDIVYSRPLDSYVRYFFSGGLNFRQLVPDFLVPTLHAIEFLLKPIARVFALHQVIVIKKLV